MQERWADPDVPVAVRIEAFTPRIPGDAESSGLPLPVLHYVLVNRTNKPVYAPAGDGMVRS